MTTKKTYGDFPGVQVTTASGDLTVESTDPDLTEQEYQLITILLVMTMNRSEAGMLSMDAHSAATALQCYGYDEYEALPMVWKTMEEAAERYYTE